MNLSHIMEYYVAAKKIEADFYMQHERISETL